MGSTQETLPEAVEAAPEGAPQILKLVGDAPVVTLSFSDGSSGVLKIVDLAPEFLHAIVHGLVPPKDQASIDENLRLVAARSNPS